MPTIWRKDRYRYFFYSNEGREPAHVHVERGDGWAKIWLDPVRLAAHSGLTNRQLAKVLIFVKTHRVQFKQAWHDHFQH